MIVVCYFYWSRHGPLLVMWCLLFSSIPFCCIVYWRVKFSHTLAHWRYVVNSLEKYSPPWSNQRHWIFQLYLSPQDFWTFKVNKNFTIGTRQGDPCARRVVIDEGNIVPTSPKCCGLCKPFYIQMDEVYEFPTLIQINWNVCMHCFLI